MWVCVILNGQEWSHNAKIVNISKTIDEAIQKSDWLEQKGILTIIREKEEYI